MNCTIRNFICNKNLILPSIQRGFVWNEEQICRLFDSILRGYPIGNLLMWELNGKDLGKKDIKFYSFLDEYNLMNGEYNNEIKNQPPDKQFLAVLDGQQRTQSLLLGLQGKIIAKEYRARKNREESYQKKSLYINLIGKPNEEENYKYELKFLSKNEIEKENTVENPKKWFEIGRTINYNQTSQFQQEILNEMNITENEKLLATEILAELYEKINLSEKIISWYEIPNNTDIEEVLDIFVRTNSGGEVLTKTDLLFSTIVASWDDFRENVEQLLITINNKNGVGDKFNFNKDFIMRALLYVIDKPIEMKVNTFKSNITSIIEAWPNFVEATKSTVKLLKKLGYNNYNLKAMNAVMPIIYYIYKGGNIDNEIEKELNKYIVVSQLKKLYGVASNSTLNNIRNELTKEDDNKKPILKNSNFKFTDLKNVKIVGERDFSVDDDILESWFEEKKNDYTFMILTLLYPTAKVGSKEFHQDHMHPGSKLREIEQFKGKENLLANLQLLEGPENEEKSAKLLKDWLKEEDNYENAKKYLPNCSLELEDYEIFLKERKELMKQELKNILKILEE